MRRLFKRLVLCLLVLCLLLFAAFLFRQPLLRGMANAWIVNEPLARADAIVVLGGGLPHRAIAAAHLYQSGLASKVLYTDVEISPSARQGLVKPETLLTRELLLKAGVPESALVSVGHSLASTYEESIAVRDSLPQCGVRSVIIPTDEFHTRRVHWIFRKLLRPAGVQVKVESVVNTDFPSTNWWRTEVGLIAFQNEVIKYGYYRLKY